MITYFKDKNNKSKKRYKNYKTLNTVLESVDSIVIIGATPTSITLLITGNGWIVLPISAGISCGLSLGNKVTKYYINYSQINTINTENNTKKTNKLSNLSINYTENHYKIMLSMKGNKKVLAIFLLNILMKQK